MLAIGDPVRWRRDIAKTDWVGVVTDCPRPRMVECDGLGLISEGLLERVGDVANAQTEIEAALVEKCRQYQDEVVQLAEVVVMQSELIFELQTQLADQEPKPRNPEKVEWSEKLIDLLEVYMVRQTGSRNPLAIADPDLRGLVHHIRD